MREKENSKSRYFFNLAYVFFGGIMFSFVIGGTIWNIIHKEKKQDNTINHIEYFKIDFGDRSKMGKSYKDVVRYRLKFSNDKSWESTVILRRKKDWEKSKLKFKQALGIDTTKILDRIPFQLKEEYFSELSKQKIIGVWEDKKGWRLLKIGDNYLVNSKTSNIGTVLLYIVFVVVELLGLFFLISPFALLLTDTKGLKNFDNLTYQPGKWDGLKYVLNRLKKIWWKTKVNKTKVRSKRSPFKSKQDPQF